MAPEKGRDEGRPPRRGQAGWQPGQDAKPNPPPKPPEPRDSQGAPPPDKGKGAKFADNDFWLALAFMIVLGIVVFADEPVIRGLAVGAAISLAVPLFKLSLIGPRVI